MNFATFTVCTTAYVTIIIVLYRSREFAIKVRFHAGIDLFEAAEKLNNEGFLQNWLQLGKTHLKLKNKLMLRNG